MRKSFSCLLAVLLSIFSFSCSFSLGNKSGLISLTLPTPSAYTNSSKVNSENPEYPKNYTIKIQASNGNYVKEIKYPSGSKITIEDLPPRNYEITVYGEDLHFGYKGSTSVKVLPRKTISAEIVLNKYLLPIYVSNINGLEETGNGSITRPYKSISKALTQISDFGGTGTIYLEGIFDGSTDGISEIPDPDFPYPIKNIHFMKNPKAEVAELSNSNLNVTNANFKLTNITGNALKIFVAENKKLILAGDTVLTGDTEQAKQITLSQGSIIGISSPLTAPEVAVIAMPMSGMSYTAGHKILCAENSSVNLENGEDVLSYYQMTVLKINFL